MRLENQGHNKVFNYVALRTVGFASDINIWGFESRLFSFKIFDTAKIKDAGRDHLTNGNFVFWWQGKSYLEFG